MKFKALCFVAFFVAACGSNAPGLSDAGNVDAGTVDPPDAGPALPSGCGPGTSTPCLDGCCSAGACVAGNAPTACGGGGGACHVCSGDSACTGQACVAGTPSNAGEACTTDAQCADVGSGATCRHSTAGGVGTYTGGYCTKACDTNADCPSDAACFGPLPQFDEPTPQCVAKCQSNKDCRNGYTCYEIGESFGVCWIDPTPKADGGVAADKIGSACTQNSECQGPRPMVSVFNLQRPRMAESASTPMVIARPIVRALQTTAAPNGICLGFQSGNEVAFNCRAHCDQAKTQSTCRPNYTCTPYTKLFTDGGTALSTDGYCDPRCDAPFVGCASGQTCNKTSGLCE